MTNMIEMLHYPGSSSWPAGPKRKGGKFLGLGNRVPAYFRTPLFTKRLVSEPRPDVKIFTPTLLQFLCEFLQDASTLVKE